MAGSELYYMAPMENIPSICSRGILSHNLAQRLPALPRSIADLHVNGRRAFRSVANGRTVHDYAPLYWATHTPMQYDITVKDKTIAQDDLVFVTADIGTVLILPGVYLTDGNAAARRTQVFRELQRRVSGHSLGDHRRAELLERGL